MMRSPRLVVIGGTLAGTVGCDQATKQLAMSELQGTGGSSHLGGLFRLGYAENPGAFLSLFGELGPAWRFWLLIVGTGALLLGMGVYLVGSRQLPGRHAAALALVLGGGLSNWLDRLLNDGRVVDFMTLALGPLRTGVFNVADVAIMAGVGFALLEARGQRGATPPSSA